MKKSISLLAILICFIFSLNATVLIVDKNPAAPAGIYAEVTDALSVANPGDTIYITPADAEYIAVTITIQVVIMGNGHYPNPNADHPWTSRINAINLTTNASGTIIMGLQVQNIKVTSNNVTDIIIAQNKITNRISGSGTGCLNWVIKNNLFEFYTSYYPKSILINNNANWHIENNIFSGRRNSGSYYFINESNNNNIIITNNIFIGDSLTSGSYQAFSNVTNAIVTNNIFYVREPINCEYCNMSNNLTYRTVQDTLPYGTNFGAYNIPNQDPLFVNAPKESHNFDYSYDYHLSPGSPGINAGSDGRNIGIYGGVYPYSDIIPIPKVLNVNVLIPNLHPGDSLEVRVKAIKY